MDDADNQLIELAASQQDNSSSSISSSSSAESTTTTTTTTTTSSSSFQPKRSPSKKFLSKLKKFELLSRGIRDNEAVSSSSSGEDSSGQECAAPRQADASIENQQSTVQDRTDTDASASFAGVGGAPPNCDSIRKIIDSIEAKQQQTLGHSRSAQLSQSFTTNQTAAAAAAEANTDEKMLRSAMTNSSKTPPLNGGGVDGQVAAKSEFMQLRESRSKSFGCEKDLRLINNMGGVANSGRRNGAGQSHKNSSRKSSSGKAKRLKESLGGGGKSRHANASPSKPTDEAATSTAGESATTFPFIGDHLNYIDDDETVSSLAELSSGKNQQSKASSNESSSRKGSSSAANESALPDSGKAESEEDDDDDDDDDYADDVIYEGDSDENDDFGDDENFSNEYDDEEEADLKCHSAPISPVCLVSSAKAGFDFAGGRQAAVYEDKVKSAANGGVSLNKSTVCAVANTNSFIYDMNLYNDQNLLLLNEDDYMRQSRSRKQSAKLTKFEGKLKSTKAVGEAASPAKTAGAAEDKFHVCLSINSCNSSSSSLTQLAGFKMEPLVIQEDGSLESGADKSGQKTKTEAAASQYAGMNLIEPSSSSSSPSTSTLESSSSPASSVSSSGRSMPQAPTGSVPTPATDTVATPTQASETLLKAVSADHIETLPTKETVASDESALKESPDALNRLSSSSESTPSSSESGSSGLDQADQPTGRQPANDFFNNPITYLSSSSSINSSSNSSQSSLSTLNTSNSSSAVQQARLLAADSYQQDSNQEKLLSEHEAITVVEKIRKPEQQPVQADFDAAQTDAADHYHHHHQMHFKDEEKSSEMEMMNALNDKERSHDDEDDSLEDADDRDRELKNPIVSHMIDSEDSIENQLDARQNQKVSEQVQRAFVKETALIGDDNEDTGSGLSTDDENSQLLSISSMSTMVLSESQLYLKDNYEKAKREREAEQELAELEKKRLQEILDICMEFQRNEQMKSAQQGVVDPSQQQLSSSASSSPTTSSSANSTGPGSGLLMAKQSTPPHAATHGCSSLKALLTPIKQHLNAGHQIVQNASSLSASSSVVSNMSNLLAQPGSIPQSSSSTNLKSSSSKLASEADHQRNGGYKTSLSLSTSTEHFTSKHVSNGVKNSASNDAIARQDLIIQLSAADVLSADPSDKEASNIAANVNASIGSIMAINTDRRSASCSKEPSEERTAKQIKKQQKQLNKERCEYIRNLNYLKQKIQEIEMRQNEAIRENKFDDDNATITSGLDCDSELVQEGELGEEEDYEEEDEEEQLERIGHGFFSDSEFERARKAKEDTIRQTNAICHQIKSFLIDMNYMSGDEATTAPEDNAAATLEMERALLDVEHSNELKNIQNDEAKLKHLQQEHQLRLDAFNMHTAQIRNEIEMVQMTIKNVENEILILDTTLDSNLMMASGHGGPGGAADVVQWQTLKLQKEHTLEEAKRTHEDLEFQLMELEAKYETELEDIQNRLIKEQDNLLNAFKQRQANLNDYDQQQTQMLMQVKAETERLEMERQKLIDQFKKQRAQLQVIEKKLQKLQDSSEDSNDSMDGSKDDSADLSIAPAGSSNSSDQSPLKSPSGKTNDGHEHHHNVAHHHHHHHHQPPTIQIQGQEMVEQMPSPISSSTSSLTSTTTSSTPPTPPQQQQLNRAADSQPRVTSPSRAATAATAAGMAQMQQQLAQAAKMSAAVSPNLNSSRQPHPSFNQTLTPNRYVASSSSSSSTTATPHRVNPNSTNANNVYLSPQQSHYQAQQKYQNQLQNHLILSVNNLNNAANKLNGNANNLQAHNNQQQQYKKHLSQSFRDILENTLLVNGMNEPTQPTTNPSFLTPMHTAKAPSSVNQSPYMSSSAKLIVPNSTASLTNQMGKMGLSSPSHYLNPANSMLGALGDVGGPRYTSKCLNKSTSSLNNNNNNGAGYSGNLASLLNGNGLAPSAMNTSQQLMLLNEIQLLQESAKGQHIYSAAGNPLISPSIGLDEGPQETVSPSHIYGAAGAGGAATGKVPTTPIMVNNQIAYKLAELERNLAMTKAENNHLLEQQLYSRERELHMLQDEKRKREELERKLNAEIHLRERIAEENIKLRDKKTTQARPLTRYLPVRDNNFDLRQHVENSGHQLINQIDPSTKQPLITINSNSCRGYLLKMGQKFKTWNKRWFVFDRQKRTLSYYMDRHETKLRGCIYFQSISEVYVDHMRTIKSPDQKSTFVVKTLDRNFYFVAPSSELMRIWVDVIFTGAEGYLEFIE